MLSKFKVGDIVCLNKLFNTDNTALISNNEFKRFYGLNDNHSLKVRSVSENGEYITLEGIPGIKTSSRFKLFNCHKLRRKQCLKS